MDPDKQVTKQDKAPQIAPYRFKKGFSGNPKGRPKGKTLKEFAREYLESLPDDEKIEYLSSLPTSLVWQMAEGNPETKTKVEGSVKHVFTEEELENAKSIIIKRISGGASESSIRETDAKSVVPLPQDQE